MAARPVFVPTEKGSRLVDEPLISFTWHPGMAPSQKRKNIKALHEAAAGQGLAPLLEISSKSELDVGRDLSAFSLALSINGRRATVETAYQGSKVFDRGGPYQDLYFVTSREARGDERIRNSGRLIGFHFEDRDYPTTPATAFYDWLYLNAMFRDPLWPQRLISYRGFTDIEFNPEKSLNCQGRSCATFMSLYKRELLDDAVESFDTFRELLQTATV
jgi:hypothetical protein